MNKAELLNVFECQKEQENATENLLIKKRELFKERCEKLYERFNTTLDELITPEIIEIAKIVGIIDVNIDEQGSIIRFHFNRGYMVIEFIRVNKRAIETYKSKLQDGTCYWCVYDVKSASKDCFKYSDEQLSYSSDWIDLYERFINEIESHISEFYQKLADKNQERIDRRNQNLANTNTGDETKAKKSYTIQITIEEDN